MIAKRRVLGKAGGSREAKNTDSIAVVVLVEFTKRILLQKHEIIYSEVYILRGYDYNVFGIRKILAIVERIVRAWNGKSYTKPQS